MLSRFARLILFILSTFQVGENLITSLFLYCMFVHACLGGGSSVAFKGGYNRFHL
jgi:hypothetical protein